MKKETKQIIHTAKELKSLEALEVENVKVVSSMKGRDAETSSNDKIVATVRKALNYKDEKDPAKRRQLRSGK